MAQRRMFSLKIIDTDAFIDMPISTRLLYYDLSMRADDDGFVASPKKITKMIGCSEDDLKLLIGKQFVIPFESGVCVIKDWKIHNYIRGDRYTETQYKNEKSLLSTDNNGSYVKHTKNNVIPNDNQMSYQMDTQDRLGKDRIEIGKGSLNNNGTSPDKPCESSKKNDGGSSKNSSEQYNNYADTFPLDDCADAINADYYFFDAEEVSAHFADSYLKHIGEEHPRYSLQQLKDCFDVLEEQDISTETIGEAIDNYFATELNCDYRFSHFCTPGILTNRLLEIGKENKRDGNLSAPAYTDEFLNFYATYPRPDDKGHSFQHWSQLIKQEGFSAEQLICCAERYAERCKNLGTEYGYMKTSANFLGEARTFESYLDANYKPVTLAVDNKDSSLKTLNEMIAKEMEKQKEQSD